MEFPIKGPTPWVLTVQQLADWGQLYADVDVLTEMRKALAWCHANPGKRKTARGMPRFLVAWLNRAMGDRQLVATVSDERRAYLEWAYAGCPHTPPCPHYTACQVVSARRA